jgi:lysozyme
MSDIAVIDISHWQADPIDWAKIKASGVVGVILKCTESNNYVDKTFRKRYDAALAAGLAVSTYHFLRPGSMVAQMNYYLNNLKPRQGERVCLDHEDAGVSLADLESCVTYLETDSRDLQVTIYSGNVIKEQLGNKHSDVLAETSLWLAQYSSTPSWPTGTWDSWTLWQYTDKGAVPGINGNIDCNKFNGSAANCALWLGPAAGQPKPAPGSGPDEQVVSLAIDVPNGIRIQVTVNGELLG